MEHCLGDCSGSPQEGANLIFTYLGDREKEELKN